MAKPSKKAIVGALLERHGRLYSEEIGFDLSKGTPAPLFQWLVASILMSARIGERIAVGAARALRAQGWTTAEKLAGATWGDRARVLNEAGYARYDERTSAMLGDTAELVVERYGGDLRRLRDEAGRDADEERRLLKRFKGLGDVGADIFFREAQLAWEELRPFADKRAVSGAERLGVANDEEGIARLADGADLARVVAALVRLDFAKDEDEVLADAGGRRR